MKFVDRSHAGRNLAKMLDKYRNSNEVLVLALPRGGVPVAYEIAHDLNLPLDTFMVRKLGLPEQPELAIGAIASGGVTFLNQALLNRFNVPDDTVQAIIWRETEEMMRRDKLYRQDKDPLSVENKIVILVDDGLATGASMLVAVRALRKMGCHKLVVAVPVAAEDVCAVFRDFADEFHCGLIPTNFSAVGQWYETFSQVSDEEVIDCLQLAHHKNAEVV